MKNKVSIAIVCMLILGLLAACGSPAQEAASSAGSTASSAAAASLQSSEAETKAPTSEADEAQTEAPASEAAGDESPAPESAVSETAGGEAAGEPQEEATDYPDLSGSTLMIYCGAGMKEPFTEIANAFHEATGCEMNVTYANAAQIQTQISTAQEGAFFIAGAAGEVEPVKDYVTESSDLVRHIPVLAVAEGNPRGISGIADLGQADIVTVIGDPESTPIGKIAVKAFEDFGVTDSVTLAATTATAPQLATVISLGEADAAVIWKENCSAEGVEICDTSDLDQYVKTIPAARLSFSQGDAAADAFGLFLESAAADEIWLSFGYELAG